MARSRSPRRGRLEFKEEIVGDFPGRVYIDVKVVAFVDQERIGYALALFDRSGGHVVLADVQIDSFWRGRGYCTRLVEHLFALVRDKYKPRTFAIDVRPRKDIGVRACSCYISALRRAFGSRISNLNLEYEDGQIVQQTINDVTCTPGNLVIEGMLDWGA